MRKGLAALAAAGLVLGSACASAGGSEAATSVRLGYFPNLTHAPAIVGLEEGLFEDNLPEGVTLAEPSIFNAGPEAVEALFADALDVTYIGPNPAINAYAESDGQAIRIVAGATSGGAALVVREGIGVGDLPGTTLATPQLGNTQDVALRAWLAEHGLETTLEGGGDVSITPQANSDTLTTFIAGDIDGAWVPEPWSTRLAREGKGKILVDEADLWPAGRFVTTHMIVRTAFLDEHPEIVRGLLRGHLAALELLNDEPGRAKGIVNDALEELSGTRLDESVLDTAWDNLTFTPDPIADSLRTSAAHAEELELLDPVDLAGIYDLTILNALLAEEGVEEVSA